VIKDAVGTEIKPGCYIAYAVRDGSCYSALRVGLVTNVGVRGRRQCYGPSTEPVIAVTILSDDRGLKTRSAKKTTTSIPERAIVLCPDTIPDDVAALLGAA